MKEPTCPGGRALLQRIAQLETQVADRSVGNLFLPRPVLLPTL